jgi:hypothetical protein
LRNSFETGLAGMGDDRRRCVASGSCPTFRQRGSRDGPHRFPQSQPASSVPEAAPGSPQASARAQGGRIEAGEVLIAGRGGGAKRPPFSWAASSDSQGPAKASGQVGSFFPNHRVTFRRPARVTWGSTQRGIRILRIIRFGGFSRFARIPGQPLRFAAITIRVVRSKDESSSLHPPDDPIRNQVTINSIGWNFGDRTLARIML